MQLYAIRRVYVHIVVISTVKLKINQYKSQLLSKKNKYLLNFRQYTCNYTQSVACICI